MMFTPRRWLSLLSILSVLGQGVPLHGEESLIANGNFEEWQPAGGVLAEGGEYRQWALNGSNLIPAAWTLNAWFKGELTAVLDGDSGTRFPRIRAPRDRDANIELPRIDPELLKGLAVLRFRVRYRGGPVLLKSYESLTPGKAPAVITVDASSGPPMGGRSDNTWRTFECRYFLPDVPFRLALGVAAGREADVRGAELLPEVLELGEGGQWLNARDFGATGSGAETNATVTAGSHQIAVAEIEDFAAGQNVTLSKCNPQYNACTVRGPTSMYGKCDLAFDDALEVRGFDGSGGDWLVFIIEVTSVAPRTFRWSDDLARSWRGTGVPVEAGWQALSGGLEIRFKESDQLAPGHVLSISARTQLRTVIERVEGNTVWLRDPPTRSSDQAVMKHSDTAALQEAVDVAAKLGLNLHIPDGHYRLHRGLHTRGANLTIAGRSGEKTLLDITDGVGAVIDVRGGENVTVRNLKMVGHTSLAEKPGTMRNVNRVPFWCCALKPCSAMTFHSVGNMLVENVHASKMASEAFYCQAASRVGGETPPKQYTRSLIFRRCSVTDCAANAFNNNDTSENTTVEYCRIDGAGWHAYEGPARFIRLIGNYVRNAGPFTIGDMSHRHKHLNELGCGQAIIRDNVFESGGRCGGITVNHGARQVCIANNIFVNYNGTAINVSSHTTRNSFPSKEMTVTGNIIDLTYRGEGAKARTGIKIDASHVIVSDNQVYVRGDRIVGTTGISLTEGIQDVIVHDNQIRNCGRGVTARRRPSAVSAVVDAKTFKERSLPLEWHVSECYRGWHVVWLADRSVSTIDVFDPDTLEFRLTEAKQDLDVGDSFELFPPESRWLIHDNIVSDCMVPVSLDVYGSSTSLFRSNQVSRGRATDVACAIRVAGRFSLIDNQFHGFETEDCMTLELVPDKAGRPLGSLIRGNLFQQSRVPVVERASGLWGSCHASGNLHSSPSSWPLEPFATPLTVVPAEGVDTSRRVPAPAPPTQLKIDGDTTEWPWKSPAGVGRLAIGPGGEQAGQVDLFCAAADGASLYLAFRITHGRANAIVHSEEPYRGDGLEIAFRNRSATRRTPIFMLWCSPEPRVVGTTHGGATVKQAKTLEEAITYSARTTPDGWTCELRIPFAGMGLTRADVSTLKFNVGSLHKKDDMWLVWTTTGAAIYQVDSAGDIVLE
ncbi:MAG: hypothetical protein HN742_33980 [Lentisphaerae bacterium]|jgi:hypothetical protein|nr:hypothetical protein [Lentisphaerota bacterium]MBT5609113.1 hypothetical protein [Lentisphaerota bacterium]MBT7061195.1 hypothetical protein [Lentisphaerota bacterium]MBT7846931.1 hypothetical protein [Lentisphaerota bacterium]